MKKLLLLLSISATLGHSQTTNCCDSLIKIINGKPVKAVCRKPIKAQNHDIIICIDNSHSANNYASRQRGQMDTLIKPTQYPNPTVVDNKTTSNQWLPLIAAIIGGLMVWLGQFFDRKSKSKAELKKALIEQFAEMERLLFNLKMSLKELSTHKNQRELYWNYYMDEFHASDKNIENEKKYLDKHYISCESIITTTLKIGEIVSEYYSVASNFSVLSNLRLDLTFVSEFGIKTDYSDAKTITEGATTEKANEEYENNTKALAAEYIALLSKFDSLNSTIKSSLK